MSAQDHVEKALRKLHVLLSEAATYDREKNLVIVDKKKMIEILRDLNEGVYEVMDEHELTKRGREQAEREQKRRNEEMVMDANRKAEDVYAASVLYTDEALKRVQFIMQDTMNSVKDIYAQMEVRLQKEKAHVQYNQTELMGTLHDLHDTNKYLQLIEDRNKKLLKERAEAREEEMPQFTAAPKPEIRINEAFFREHGYSLDEEEEMPEEKIEKVTAEVSVNLDSEYFKWKEKEASGHGDIPEIKRNDKKSLLGKILKG